MATGLAYSADHARGPARRTRTQEAAGWFRGGRARATRPLAGATVIRRVPDSRRATAQIPTSRLITRRQGK
jgi:hypothetical protein